MAAGLGELAGELHTELSHQCRAAISTDISLANTYCQRECLAMEQNLIGVDEFNTACVIDHRLYTFGTLEDYKPDVNAHSSCFSFVSPSADHVMKRTDVEYPGACQELCQKLPDCSWFVVARSPSQKYRCALLNNESVTNDVILSSRPTTAEKYCSTRYNGKLVDCAFGSPVCLIDPHEYYGLVDEMFLEVSKDELDIISGPKNCGKSSPDASVEICTSLYVAYHAYLDGGYVAPGILEATAAPDTDWYGIDRLWGAGSLFSMDEWKQLFPTYGRGWDNIPIITDIALGLRELEGLVAGLQGK